MSRNKALEKARLFLSRCEDKFVRSGRKTPYSVFPVDDADVAGLILSERRESKVEALQSMAQEYRRLETKWNEEGVLAESQNPDWADARKSEAVGIGHAAALIEWKLQITRLRAEKEKVEEGGRG